MPTLRSTSGCTQCHSLTAEGGPSVGPNLRAIGTRLTREQILEALVDPSARIAPGYGNGPSVMPPMHTLLSRREIRDVVEFLSTDRGGNQGGRPGGGAPQPPP